LQVDQRGADRPARQPGRDALQGPGRVEGPDVAGGQEDGAPGHAEDERRDDDREAAPVVGDRSENQQRGQQDQDVHGEQAVRVAAENRNWAWYTRYSGDAAAEAKNTMRNNPASVQNAAALGIVLIPAGPPAR
jgi:hypothetical protein